MAIKGDMLMNIKTLRKDVRGAALVYVIVAAAILVLLGAATTATAYANLRATQIQEKSDNNFYSADTVMNAIVSGLESDISTAYETAFAEVITNIDNYPDDEAVKTEFKNRFLNEIGEILNDGEESFEFMYKPGHIQNYVQAVFKDDIKYTVSARNGDNHLDLTDEGVILRNLHVTYEDDSGYYDEITTDIKIAIPEINWSTPQDWNSPSHGLVIDDGLEIMSGKGLQINGNTYININSDRHVVLLKNNTSLSITTPDELIAGGLIKTEENTKLTISGTTDSTTGNRIWTENFDFGRYTDADIVGLISVYDDLEVNGSYTNVRLAGEYYGYSKSSEDADESSSININGAHTSLDIRELDTLVIAGSSYVSTSEVVASGAYQNTSNIQSGEALAVKSNQLAYLVDDKEFSDTDLQGFVSNPMSYAQYEKMLELNRGWNNVVGAITNKTLSYGKSYAEYGASVTPVFSSRDNGTVYLYLNFTNPDKAAAYFVDAYKGNTLLSQRLRTYAAQYITSLYVNSDSELLVNENYINVAIDGSWYGESNLPQIQDGLGYDQNKPSQNSMDSFLNNCRYDYLGEEDVADDGKKYEVTYDKMINEDKLKEFIAHTTSAAYTVDNITNNKITTVQNGVIITGTSGAQAIIIDNAGKEAYELGTGGGLLIATGDVKLTGDWIGSIIVGGRVYCTMGSKDIPINVTVDETTVESVTPLYVTSTSGGIQKSMMVLNIFKGHEDAGVNTATNDEGINADMISNCITFTNWNRD
jgi:hypothetical protein